LIDILWQEEQHEKNFLPLEFGYVVSQQSFAGIFIFAGNFFLQRQQQRGTIPQPYVRKGTRGSPNRMSCFDLGVRMNQKGGEK